MYKTNELVRDITNVTLIIVFLLFSWLNGLASEERGNLRSVSVSSLQVPVVAGL